jgi:RNA recognition motif-containing protein
MNPAILRNIFQAFGAIESVRVLSHKNCGFINFDHQEDAVRARKILQNKEILGPSTGAVRIGFAKVPPNNPDEAEEIPGTSGGGQVTPPLPSALVHQPALSQSLLPTQISSSSFSLNNHQQKVPSSSIVNSSPPQSSSVNINNSSTGSETYQNAQWATAMMMTSMMMNASGQQQTTQPNLYTAIASERQFIMQQLGCEPSEKMKGKKKEHMV